MGQLRLTLSCGNVKWETIYRNDNTIETFPFVLFRPEDVQEHPLSSECVGVRDGWIELEAPTDLCTSMSVSARVARDRLSALGFPYERSRSDVRRALAAGLRIPAEVSGSEMVVKLDDGLVAGDDRNEDTPSALPFDERKLDVALGHFAESFESVTHAPALEAWSLIDGLSKWDLPFRLPDCEWPHPLTGLSLALHHAPDDCTLRYDLSGCGEYGELVDDEEFDPYKYGIRGDSDVRPAVILTEGTFDAEVVRFAVERTHPHLRDYVIVPDFGFKRAGGSSALLQLVRGFCDAQIRESRFIAVFDNDRIGTEDANRLRRSTLPPNFAIKTLPDLDELRSYPVELPSGIVEMNVNSWGVAIELLLALEAGNKPPLRLGYQPGTDGGYQGIMLKSDKEAVQNVFRSTRESVRQWPFLSRLVRHILDIAIRNRVP